MIRKVSHYFAGLGLFLVLLAWNPFIDPELYFDISRSFGFQALTKVTLLSIITVLLCLIVLLKIVRVKKVVYRQDKKLLYILALLLLSPLLSLLFAINKSQALLGHDSVLEHSFIEQFSILLFVLVLIFIIRRNNIFYFLKIISLGSALMSCWLIIRFSFPNLFSNAPFLKYLNAATFFPSGNYTAIAALLTLGTIISTGVFVRGILIKEKTKYFIFNAILFFLNAIGFINLAAAYTRSGSIFLILFLSIALLYMVLPYIKLIPFHNVRKERKLWYGILFLVVTSAVGGSSYYFLTKERLPSNNSYPVSLSDSYTVIEKALEEKPFKILTGYGNGTYSYAFDKYKSGTPTTVHVLTNTNAPIVPEFRIHEPANAFLSIFFTNGILGIAAYLIALGYGVFIGVKKKSKGIRHRIVITSFVSSGVLFFITPYDVVLHLLFWVLFALTIIIFVPLKEFSLYKNRKTKFAAIVSAIVVLVISLSFSLTGVQLTKANYFAMKAKEKQAIGDINGYKEYSNFALTAWKYSPVFQRENINARSIDLLQNNKSGNSGAENEIRKFISQTIKTSPEEYKNYYFAGLVTAEISKTNSSFKDTDAIDYFRKALLRNPSHADSYFQLSLLYERQKDYNTAFSSIEKAVSYNQQNLIYQIQYADTLVYLQDFQRARAIYQGFKNLVSQNPGNQQLLAIYRSENIEKKLEELQ